MIFSDLRARALARELDLDLDDVNICVACLSFVSFALDSGEPKEIRRTTREVTPWLWDEGLALPLQVALERARRAGVADADAAIRDVQLNGSDSATARAVVQRLAADLTQRTRERMRADGLLPPAAGRSESGSGRTEQADPPPRNLVLMRIDLPGPHCRGSPDDVA